MMMKDKIKSLAGLYVIIDTQALRGRSEKEVAQQAIKGGAKVIQLRDKERSRAELLGIAQQLSSICAENEVLFIMNDYLDIALATDADGLHLGQDDLPIPVARRIFPGNRLIGCSTHSLAEALEAQSQGADYIAIGSIYPTMSKESAKVIGLGMLQQIREAIAVPLIAIGGINEDNVEEVIKAGADGVAVISAVVGKEDVEGAARRLAAKIEQAKLSLEVQGGEINR